MSTRGHQPIAEIRSLYKVFGPAEAGIRKQTSAGKSIEQAIEAAGAMPSLSDVSVSVQRGEIYTIMGLSGSGKSTLVRCLNGLVTPTHGEVVIDGQSLSGASNAVMRELRQRRMSMVFQSFALLPHLSVVDNVQFGLKLRGDDAASSRTRALACIEMVGLGKWAERRVDELSGGMKQRVGLARALAPDPEILIMDEPFSALDPLIRMTLQDELLRLQAELQKTVVFVTHDFDEAARIGNRILLMKDGRVVQVGSPSEIATKPANEYVAAFTSRSDPLSFVSMGQLLRAVQSTEATGTKEAESCSTAEATTVAQALRSFKEGRGLSVRCDDGGIRVVSPEHFLQYVGALYESRGA